MAAPDELSIAETIQLARNGDQDAVGRLIERHRPWLKVLARQGLPNNLRARFDDSDLAQQTCLSAIRQIGEFEGDRPEQFMAWMRRIHNRNLLNAVRDHVHAHKRDVRLEQRLGTDRQLAAYGVEQGGPTPSEQLMNSEKAVRMAELLETLPPAQAEAIRMRYLDGERVGDIAEKLGRSYTATVGLIRRGLKSMKLDLPSDANADADVGAVDIAAGGAE